MLPKKKKLTQTQKKHRAFLKERISFHSQAFTEAVKERKKATEQRKKETNPEKSKLLKKTADNLTKLANWHRHRESKLKKRKGKLF